MIAVRDLDRRQHHHRAEDIGQHVACVMMRSGATPITRAACTYSLLRSTIVEPRTVRAYCTQPVSEIAMHQHGERERVVRVRGTARGPMPSIRSAIRIDGKREHHVAHAHDEGVDACRLTKPESRPRPKPITTEHRHQHAKSVRRRARCACRTSAPTGCRVPGRRCRAGTSDLPSAAQAGGRRESASSSVARSNGLCGATHVGEQRAEDAARRRSPPLTRSPSATSGSCARRRRRRMRASRAGHGVNW